MACERRKIAPESTARAAVAMPHVGLDAAITLRFMVAPQKRSDT
jgi:hypothetical protein